MMHEIREKLTFYPKNQQVAMLLSLDLPKEVFRQVSLINLGSQHSISLTEEQAVGILEQLKTYDDVLRPVLQRLGRQRFGW